MVPFIIVCGLFFFFFCVLHVHPQNAQVRPKETEREREMQKVGGSLGWRPNASIMVYGEDEERETR